jgi:hypothetical protein
MFSRFCPAVLLVRAGWGRGKSLESKEANLMRKGEFFSFLMIPHYLK